MCIRDSRTGTSKSGGSGGSASANSEKKKFVPFRRKEEGAYAIGQSEAEQNDDSESDPENPGVIINEVGDTDAEASGNV